MIKLTVDEIEVHVPEGSTILEAADAAEIYIPRLCSHPELPAVDPEKLEVWHEVFWGTTPKRADQGSQNSASYEGCLLCLVEVRGRPEPVRACITPAEEGMRVLTSSPEIDSRRRARLKKLFSTHPHACVQCAQRAGCALEPCSTNVAKEERCCPIFHVCELRKVAEFIGIPDDTPRYRPANFPIVEDEPLFLRDYNLCIGCLRCVRVCREVRKIDALGFVLDGDGEPVVGTKAPTLKDSGCHFCLGCVEVCPTGSLRLKFEDPRVDGERASRCVAACPAGIDIPRYLREIRRGEFARAEAVIRETAPLPRILGQVCFHPCEEECLRRELSEPLAICSLKRAAMDHSGEAIWKSHLQPRPPTGKKVAILGAGPTGLAAAWFLRLKGHDVILFDSDPMPGGWLRSGIPRYRLSPDALEADVQDITSLGIILRAGVEVGKEITFGNIREAHDAVLVAVGARNAKPLTGEGVDLPGVENGLDLLKELATGKEAEKRSFAGETIVVIGGGNVAIDVARTTLRLGSGPVHLYCLEEREEMPAHSWEIEEAEREGVVIHPGRGPTRIAGQDRVERVDFQKCISVFDDEGQFAPRFDDRETTSQGADRVLIAIGQEPALGFLDGAEGLSLTEAGTIEANPTSMQTSLNGVFAAGEVVTGPASVIEAIAQGRRAASGIDRYLGGDGDIHVPLVDETEPDGELSRVEGFPDLTRVPTERLAVEEATGCFALVEAGYAPDDATREAERCLRCDLRFLLRPPQPPPEPWVEFTVESIDTVPEAEGVYQLLDENKAVYAIKGVDNLRQALSGLLETTTKAKFFLFDEDPMFSKRESELIQQYLQQHGSMPPGEGEDELDDLF